MVIGYKFHCHWDVHLLQTHEFLVSILRILSQCFQKEVLLKLKIPQQCSENLIPLTYFLTEGHWLQLGRVHFPFKQKHCMFYKGKISIKTWYTCIYVIYEIMTIFPIFKNDDIYTIMALITYNKYIKWTLFDLLVEIIVIRNGKITDQTGRSTQLCWQPRYTRTHSALLCIKMQVNPKATTSFPSLCVKYISFSLSCNHNFVDPL